MSAHPSPDGLARPATIPWTDAGPPEQPQRFQAKRLAAAAGGRDLGATLYRVPAGSKAFPLHWHAGNEEAYSVVSGRGLLRLPGRSLAIQAGDWIALPAGPDHAHQVVNDSDADLIVLAISTMRHPDVVHYPESGKVGVFTATPPGVPPPAEQPRKFLRAAAEVGYWEGEV